MSDKLVSLERRHSDPIFTKFRERGGGVFAEQVDVILVDANGDPLTSLPISIPSGESVRVNNALVDPIPSIIVDVTGTPFGTAGNAISVTHVASDPLVAALKAEDAASADGDKGFILLAVRKATPANTSGTDGDYEALQMSAGRLWASVVNEAAENHIGAVGGHIARVSATFTRPNDTTQYASGDLVANNTVASSVTPMTFAISRASGKGGMVRRARIRKTGTGLTSAQFRIHLYSASPTQTGGGGAGTGDNAVWSTDQSATYAGAIDVTVDKAFTDGSAGNGIPVVGSEINFVSDTYYALLEARGTYSPAAQEQFTVELEILQN